MIAFLILAAAVPPAPLPQDVRAFLARRTQCTHWADEAPYDAARTRQINGMLRQLRCDTLDAQERVLRKRYVRQPHILCQIETEPGAGDSPAPATCRPRPDP